MGTTSIFLAEVLGTAILIFLGVGVNMTLSLKRSYGKGGGWIVTCFGWGFAVMIAIYAVGWISGAHLNPAVTIGLAAGGLLPWSIVPAYLIAEMLGAMIGATLAYTIYKLQMDLEEDKGTKLGVFSTGPSVPSNLWNFVTEALATAVLLIGILAIGQSENAVASGNAPLYVGLLITVIGMAFGGATGFAINPARDLGPRIMHAILPIKGKGDSNWAYAWVPVAGPIVGGVIGVLLFNFFISVVTK